MMEIVNFNEECNKNSDKKLVQFFAIVKGPLACQSMTKFTETNRVYILLRSALKRSVSKIVPPDDVEDIVQETYVRLCQFEQKQTIENPKAFMFKVARNLALDFVSRAETKRTTQVGDQESAFDIRLWDNPPLKQAESNNDFALFCEAVRKLPRQTRKTFVLKKVYGYSQKEIAKTLGISESTVEKHIAAGAKRCARYMLMHTDYGRDVPDNRKPTSIKKK